MFETSRAQVENHDAVGCLIGGLQMPSPGIPLPHLEGRPSGQLMIGCRPPKGDKLQEKGGRGWKKGEICRRAVVHWLLM